MNWKTVNCIEHLFEKFICVFAYNIVILIIARPMLDFFEADTDIDI